jgi:hypothetical protein
MKNAVIGIQMFEVGEEIEDTPLRVSFTEHDYDDERLMVTIEQDGTAPFVREFTKKDMRTLGRLLGRVADDEVFDGELTTPMGPIDEA